MFGFLKSRPLTPPPAGSGSGSRTGCFGKLPIQPEYIRHNMVQRKARALDQWLQAGVSLAARGQGGGAAERGSYHGVFAGSGEERALVFTVRPSCDRSGRRYPFVVFEVLGARDRDGCAAALPLRGEPFFEAATQVMSQPWHHEPLATVLGWVERVGARPSVTSAAFADDLAASQLLASLYPEHSHGVRWAHLARTVELLRQVERRTAPRVPWGLSLPLERARPTRSVSWWLRLAEGVLGHGLGRPCCLWPAHEASRPDASRLLLFFRPPSAQVAAHLLQRCGLNGTVVDPFDGIPLSIATAAPEPPATIRTLLDHLIARRVT